MRLALMHCADVYNYGDVLFPMLMEQELRARIPGVNIDFICPTGQGPVKSKAYSSVHFDQYDAIVIAGGEVVHRHDDMLKQIYRRLGLTSSIDNPTDMVFGWTGARGPFKAWFCLGVPEVTPAAQQALEKSLPKLDLVITRGSLSAKRLAQAGRTPKVAPDIGWLFPRLLPKQAPQEQQPYVVVQSMPAHAPKNINRLIKPLQKLESQGFRIKLLPLTTCWNDHVLLKKMAELSGFELLDYRQPVLDKLQILAGCTYFVGQSMHGFISTLANGKTGGLCYPSGENKFKELLEDNNIEDLRVPFWEQLPLLIQHLQSVPKERIQAVRDRAVLEVDQAFDELVERINQHA